MPTNNKIKILVNKINNNFMFQKFCILINFVIYNHNIIQINYDVLYVCFIFKCYSLAWSTNTIVTCLESLPDSIKQIKWE